MSDLESHARVVVVEGDDLGGARVFLRVVEAEPFDEWSGRIVSWEDDDRTWDAAESDTGVHLHLESGGSGVAIVATDGTFIGSGEPPDLA